jgi:hypothetical protein
MQVETYELVEGNLWASGVKHEPPSVACDGRDANVGANHHIAEEQPTTHERLGCISWRYTHDGVVGWVEAKSGRRQ